MSRGARTLLVIVIVVAVAVAAFFIGDAIAKHIVKDRLRDGVIAALGLSDEQPIDIDIPGLVIPQLIAGSLSAVQASADDISVDGVSGDVSVDLHGVPTRGDDTSDLGGTATVSLDQDAVQTLVGRAVGDDLGVVTPTVSLGEGAATIGGEIGMLGITVPLELTVSPGVEDGDVQLTPTSLAVGDLEVTTDDIASLPIDASGLIQPITVCSGDTLPAGVEVADVAVTTTRLTVDVSLADGFAADASAFSGGVCA